MILAAGRGERMRPLSLSTPKPLLTIHGVSMLSRALDKLAEAGVQRVVINTHWLAEKIKSQVPARKDMEMIYTFEPELLDTAGGVQAALPLLGDAPFYVVGGDAPWWDAHELQDIDTENNTGAVPSALQSLAAGFDAHAMLARLLLLPRGHVPGLASGTTARGDFTLQPDGTISRHHSQPPYSHHYISVQLVSPEIFANETPRVFSFNALWDKAEAMGKLYGLEHKGCAYHVSTPEDWQQVQDWQPSR